MTTLHLTSDESARCREAYELHVDDYAVDVFQLRAICADLGQHPCDDQLNVCMRLCNGRMDFNMLCRFALYLKYVFTQQDAEFEEEDDTNCAFAALTDTATLSEQQAVPATRLLETCESFSLRTDFLDGVVEEVNTNHTGILSLAEFKELWSRFTPDPGQGILASSHITHLSKTPRLFSSQAPLENVIGAFLNPSGKISQEEQEQVFEVKRFSLSRRSTLLPKVKEGGSIKGGEGGGQNSVDLIHTHPPSVPNNHRIVSGHRMRDTISKAFSGRIIPHPPSTAMPTTSSGGSPRDGCAGHMAGGINFGVSPGGTPFDPTTMVYQPVFLPAIKPRNGKVRPISQQMLGKKLEAMRSSRSRISHNSRNLKGFVLHDELERN